MMPDRYQERVRAQLDVMRRAEKDRILLGLIEQLYPKGDPDHPVDMTAFLAEVIRLLTAFHPDHLSLPEEQGAGEASATVPEF